LIGSVLDAHKAFIYCEFFKHFFQDFFGWNLKSSHTTLLQTVPVAAVAHNCPSDYGLTNHPLATACDTETCCGRCYLYGTLIAWQYIFFAKFQLKLRRPRNAFAGLAASFHAILLCTDRPVGIWHLNSKRECHTRPLLLDNNPIGSDYQKEEMVTFMGVCQLLLMNLRTWLETVDPQG
jgi:hypothetical protein